MLLRAVPHFFISFCCCCQNRLIQLFRMEEFLRFPFAHFKVSVHTIQMHGNIPNFVGEGKLHFTHFLPIRFKELNGCKCIFIFISEIVKSILMFIWVILFTFVITLFLMNSASMHFQWFSCFFFCFSV